MKTDGKPRLFFIAGPNGAGKTTYAFAHIRAVAASAHFVNLDEIARGLEPLAPELARQRSARVALEMTKDFIDSGTTFSIETTLAGKTHLRTLDAARAKKFEIVVLYFAPATPETCLARIARRVAEGGHDVPETDVRRRFARSLESLPVYAARADVWRVFDVSHRQVKVAAEGRAGCVAARSDQSALPARLRDWLGSLPDCEEA